MIQQENWSNYSKKYLRHPKNPEFVTGRVNIINDRKKKILPWNAKAR